MRCSNALIGAGGVQDPSLPQSAYHWRLTQIERRQRPSCQWDRRDGVCHSALLYRRGWGAEGGWEGDTCVRFGEVAGRFNELIRARGDRDDTALEVPVRQ